MKSEIKSYIEQCIPETQVVSVEDCDTDAQRKPWTFWVTLIHKGHSISGLFITGRNGEFPSIERITSVIEGEVNNEDLSQMAGESTLRQKRSAGY